ncbi:MAG: hypothetical protein QNJ53_16565 [Pleurocapsa sp. MO_192.B19]|nr:hypothetical protein [Pleurocapsa sp. MO_192.B19]
MVNFERLIIGLSLVSFTALSSQAIAQTNSSSEVITRQQIAQTKANNHQGVERLIGNPTQYGFACGEAPGKVKGVSLNGQDMVIEYEYLSGEEMRTGKLIGQIDSAGEFRGTYNTNTSQGLVQGAIALSFVADGTANGNYRNGLGRVSIFRN